MYRATTWIPLVLCLVLSGCGPGDEAAMEEQPPPAAEPAAADPLAAFAGTWNVTASSEAGDSLTAYELVATATQDGWMMTLPEREPIPVRVISADGDSVVAEAGPYNSVLRPGTQVTTRTVTRVQGDQLTGTFRANYQGAGADTLVTGRLTGMRVR